VAHAVETSSSPAEARFTGPDAPPRQARKPCGARLMHARDWTLSTVKVVDSAAKANAANFCRADESGFAEVAFGETLPARRSSWCFATRAFNASCGPSKVQLATTLSVVPDGIDQRRYSFPVAGRARASDAVHLTLTYRRTKWRSPIARRFGKKVSADASGKR